MAYDPQHDRPRHRADLSEASPVDSLLDGAPEMPQDNAGPAAGPAPASSAGPGPTGSWSDRLLYSAGLSTMLRTALALLALGWLWRRWARRRSR